MSLKCWMVGEDTAAEQGIQDLDPGLWERIVEP